MSRMTGKATPCLPDYVASESPSLFQHQSRDVGYLGCEKTFAKLEDLYLTDVPANHIQTWKESP